MDTSVTLTYGVCVVKPHAERRLAQPAMMAGVTEAIDHARELASTARRVVLGVVGPPGAGKSTLAEEIVADLGSQAVLVPMDGFHLAQAELRRLGRAERKGAPDTFDARGYAALLRRIHDDTDDVVYAPAFDRSLEEPVAGAIAVEPSTTVVVTEGNYMLLDHGPWSDVRSLLDAAWYLDVDDDLRRQRLIRRHRRFGRSHDDAVAWVDAVDEPNAALVRASRRHADLIV